MPTIPISTTDSSSVWNGVYISEPNLNLLFNYNMPFRAIAKMTGGICTMEMAEGILTIVNGHFFKGMGAIIGGFFRSGKKRKAANAIH